MREMQQRFALIRDES